MKRKFLAFLIAAMVLLLVLGVFGGVFVHGRRAKAQQLAERGLYSHARVELASYLWVFAQDHAARLLMAESLVNDPKLDRIEGITAALEQLQRIPDESAVGVRARIQEAKLLMLELHQMGRAEKVLQHVRELAPKEPEPHYLYWKLLDLTGRSHHAESVFWQFYDLIPADEVDPGKPFPIRADILRQWYMSQFYPASANMELEQRMKLLGPDELPTDDNESQRFDYLKKAEPDSPLGYAALGQWFVHEKDNMFALKMLNEAIGKVPDEDLWHPFYVGTKVHCLFDLGKYDEAVALMDKWPEPRSGHEYHKWKAIILHEVDRKREEALQFYDLALGEWPGQVDWQLRHKKSRCLSELKRPAEAEHERQRELAIEKMMGREGHEQARIALEDLSKPENMEAMATFYEKIDLPRLAEAWRSQIEVLARLGEMTSQGTGEPSAAGIRE